MSNANKAYSVTLWLTHPMDGNDDCMTGDDFATEQEARDCMSNLSGHFNMVYHNECAFVELDGPNVHEVIERPGVARRARRKAAADDAEWVSERRMQAGMLGGCQAYNDYE